MKLSSQQIAAFTEVFRHRNVSRAAQALGVTQSAVTQHLGNLERLMGTQLFLRSRTGLEPTRPALELYALSDRMRILEQLILEKMNAYAALEGGHLTIIANAPRPAMPLIAEFVQRFPKVRIVFSLLSWTLAMQRISAREVDIGIVTEPEEREGLHLMEIARARYVAMIRKDHPLAARTGVGLADLAENVVIVPEQGSLTQRVVAETLRAHGVAFPRMVEMTTFPVVKEAVLHGIGIGVLLEDSVISTEEAVLLPIREMKQVYRTYLVTPDDKRDLHVVRSFIDSIG